MDALAELLLQLVHVPSLSGEEGALGDRVQERLRAAGFRTGRALHGVVAEAGPEGAPILMLCSHLDTVPAGAGWKADPWRVVWRRDRLVGLGANDAKASVAAMIHAGEAWLADGAAGGFRLRLAFTAQEETTNRGMEEMLSQWGKPDLAVIGEPTGLEVVNAQSGLAVLESEWTGRSCHAAHVGRVVHENALLAAATDLVRFPPFVELGQPHPQCGPSTLAVTVLHSGERHNRVPDRALATLDARLAPGVDASDACAEAQARLPGAQVRCRSSRLRPVETPAAHPLVRAALQASGRTRPVGSCTMSDMALLQGVPAVKCGPGQSERSHTPNEFVTREELEAGYNFYARLLQAPPISRAG